MMTTSLALLLVPSLVYSVAQSQDVTFINPPETESSGSEGVPVWRAQSRQTFELFTHHAAYMIYVVQDDVIPADEAMEFPIKYETNNPGYNTHGWYVDIPAENLALSPAFHIDFRSADSNFEGHHIAAYFNVSAEESAAGDSETAGASTSSSSSKTHLSITATFSRPEDASVSAADETSTRTPTVITQPSPTSETLPAASTSETLPAVLITSTWHTSVSQLDPVASISSNAPAPSAATTLDGNGAAETSSADGTLQQAREDDLGIWIGVSLGVGAPVMALAAVAAFWNVRRRRKSGVELNY